MAINRIVGGLVKTFWGVVILLVLAAAAYQSLGQVMLPRLHQYHAGIESQLSKTLKVPVSIGTIAGDWQQFQPVVTLGQIQLNSTASDPLAVQQIHLQFNILSSLLAWEPIFTKLVVEGVNLKLEKDENGAWQAAGLSFAANVNESSAARISGEQILHLVQEQRHLELNRSLIQIDTPAGEQKIAIETLSLDCIDSFCAAEGQVRFEEEQISELHFSGNFQDLGKPSRLVMDSFLELEPIRLERWLRLFDINTPVDLSFERFQLGGKVWLQWLNGRPSDIRGALYVPDLKLVPGGEELNPVDYISSDFVWQMRPAGDAEIWSVWLNDFTFKWQGEVFEPAQQRWSMLEENGDRKIQLLADSLDLEFTNNTLLAIEQLPTKLRKILATLKPRGRLVNAQITYAFPGQEEQNKVPDVHLEANLSGVGVSAWMNAPAVDGLDGYISVSPQSGSVEFESTGLSLHFPRLYSRALVFESANGALRWTNRGEALWMESDLLTLRGKVGTVLGEFQVDSPRDGAEPRIEMLLALEQAPLTGAIALVPDKRIDRNLNDWLRRAVQGGTAEEGYFLFSGSLRKGAKQGAHTLQLKMNVSDTTLSFHEDWPAITDLRANLDITQSSADVYQAQGRLLNLELPTVSANWSNQGGRGKVIVSADATGPANDALRLLTDTPVRAGLFDLIDDFSAAGNVAADLQLAIPISDLEEAEVGLSLDVKELELAIDSLDLEFNGITGSFAYHTVKGISGATSKASLFGEPIELEVVSTPVKPVKSGTEDKRASMPYQSSMQIKGRVSASALRDWQENIPFLTQVQGETDYTALLKVGGSSVPTLGVTSSLKGIELQAPDPLYKPTGESTSFTYLMEFDDETIHRISYADLIETALVFEDSSFSRGEIRFGTGRAILADIPGIYLRGTIDKLDVLAWWDFFEKMAQLELAKTNADASADSNTKVDVSKNPENSASPGTEFTDRIKEIELTVGNLIVDELVLPDLNLRMEQIDGDWWAQLENETINGRVRFYTSAAKPALVDLEYLKLPESEDEGDALSALQPQDIPAFNFSVKQLMLGEEDYGKWVFNYRPAGDGARLEHIVAQVKGFGINGELFWRFADDSHSSQFIGSAHSSDLEATMEAWGYPNTLEGKSLDVHGDLTWSGTPTWAAPERLVGTLNVSARDGRFVDLDSAPAALKLFGLFNLSAVARRIRLDFSDITKSGYSYDAINGALHFDAGTVSTTESILINGPSAKFKLDGTTDLINQELDQNLVVVLPLSDNIPIAATVLGAPQVGIPLWLLNKVFGNMFETFTSAEYKVTGPIADPTVEGIRRYEKRMSESEESSTKAPASSGKSGGKATSQGTANAGAVTAG